MAFKGILLSNCWKEKHSTHLFNTLCLMLLLLSVRKPISCLQTGSLPILTELCTFWEAGAAVPYLAHAADSRGAQTSRAQRWELSALMTPGQSTQLGLWERVTQRLTHARGYRQRQKINCGKFSLHSKAAEGGIVTGLQRRSFCRSIFDLPKWSLLVVMCHKPHPDSRVMKFCEFRTDPHSLTC